MIKILRKIKRVLYSEFQFYQLIIKSGTQIFRNRIYKQNLNDFEKCFLDKAAPTSNPEIISRIILSYKKAKEIQIKTSKEFQVGNEWLPIYEQYMNEIISALLSSENEKVAKIYANFMREDCSIGLHGLPVNMKQTYFQGRTSNINKKKYLFDSVFTYESWRRLTQNKFANSELFMPDFGNPYGFYIDDMFIRTGAMYLHYYAQKIKELLSETEKKSIILELGGGYGGLAYFLNDKMNCVYIDIDLPENMALSAYYLLSCFPNKNILLFGEKEICDIALTDYDIILIPNFEISKIPTNSVDMIFNSYSLAEMTKETIDLYIKELMRMCNNYFMHINHIEQRNSYGADDFGIDKAKFELLSRQLAIWGLGRNLNPDEFEFIYKKRRS